MDAGLEEEPCDSHKVWVVLPNENVNIGNEAKKIDENIGNKNEITNDNLKFESSSNTSNMEHGDCAAVSSVKTEESSSVTENVVETKETFLDFIPEKPTPFQTPYAENAPDMVHYIGDPPFEQLGLNSWWPTGWVQWGMEHIHVGLDMPWLGTILLSKFFFCLLIFWYFSKKFSEFHSYYSSDCSDEKFNFSSCRFVPKECCKHEQSYAYNSTNASKNSRCKAKWKSHGSPKTSNRYGAIYD